MYRTLVVDRLHQLEQGIEELAQEGYKVHTISSEKDRDGMAYFWALLELSEARQEAEWWAEQGRPTDWQEVARKEIAAAQEPKGFTDEQEWALARQGVTDQALHCATRLLQDPGSIGMWQCIECQHRYAGHRHGTEDYGPICCQCANRRSDGVPILEEVQSGKG